MARYGDKVQKVTDPRGGMKGIPSPDIIAIDGEFDPTEDCPAPYFGPYDER